MDLSGLEGKLGNPVEGFTHDILIGNGLGLSHPDPIVSKLFKFNSEALIDYITGKLFIMQSEENILCPEEFLEKIRLDTSIEIIGHYMKKEIFDAKKSFSGRSLITKAQAIFTTNYDPLMFHCLLKEKGTYFSDGFKSQNSENGISLDDMKYWYEDEKYEDDQKLFFLHGAVHIYTGKNDKKYYRIKSGKGGFCSTVQGKFDKFRNGNQKEYIPLMILEGRSDIKKCLIKKDPLLKYCYEELKSKSKDKKTLVIFGMSFGKDDYLVETIKKSAYKNIYSNFTIRSD
ncbi:MAG: DUF4917 family protein [bacterium]|nr:DUF4917 family protein [bacterium]